jgi:hypothetical protein
MGAVRVMVARLAHALDGSAPGLEPGIGRPWVAGPSPAIIQNEKPVG